MNAHNITNGTIIIVIFTKKYNKVVKLTFTYFYFGCLLSHIGWAFVGVALVGGAFVGGAFVVPPSMYRVSAQEFTYNVKSEMIFS